MKDHCYDLNNSLENLCKITTLKEQVFFTTFYEVLKHPSIVNLDSKMNFFTFREMRRQLKDESINRRKSILEHYYNQYFITI